MDKGFDNSNMAAFFKERQKGVSPYASQAVCSKCKHCVRVKTKAFCIGFGIYTKISDKVFYSTKKGYCTQYYPKRGRE